MNRFYEEAKGYQEELISHRRRLHQNPELGFELDETVAYVKNILSGMGCSPKEICRGGVTAVIGGENPGKTILLRADMDALPMNEESGLAFASKNPGCAHTCGHDMHTAMLLGAAKLLKEQEDELQGTVKLMFQPAEEQIAGARKMIESGVLEDPKVDAAIAMHVISDVPVGYLDYAPGGFAPSGDGFLITVKGKGCHGATPQDGVDPVNVAAHIAISLQALIAREISLNDQAVLSICRITAGTTGNIVPEDAVLQGTLRTYQPEVRRFLLRRIEEVADFTAKAFRASAELQVLRSVEGVVNQPYMTGQMEEILQDFPYDLKRNEGFKMDGSEDFSLISNTVPSVMFAIGAMPEAMEGSNKLHNPKVLLNEEVLPLGAAVHAHCAKQWLERNK